MNEWQEGFEEGYWNLPPRQLEVAEYRDWPAYSEGLKYGVAARERAEKAKRLEKGDPPKQPDPPASWDEGWEMDPRKRVVALPLSKRRM